MVAVLGNVLGASLQGLSLAVLLAAAAGALAVGLQRSPLDWRLERPRDVLWLAGGALLLSLVVGLALPTLTDGLAGDAAWPLRVGLLLASFVLLALPVGQVLLHHDVLDRLMATASNCVSGNGRLSASPWRNFTLPPAFAVVAF